MFTQLIAYLGQKVEGLHWVFDSCEVFQMCFALFSEEQVVEKQEPKNDEVDDRQED